MITYPQFSCKVSERTVFFIVAMLKFQFSQIHFDFNAHWSKQTSDTRANLINFGFYCTWHSLLRPVFFSHQPQPQMQHTFSNHQSLIYNTRIIILIYKILHGNKLTARLKSGIAYIILFICMAWLLDTLLLDN